MSNTPHTDPLSDAVIAEGLRLADLLRRGETWAEGGFINEAVAHYSAALREVQALRAEVERLSSFSRQSLFEQLGEVIGLAAEIREEIDRRIEHGERKPEMEALIDKALRCKKLEKENVDLRAEVERLKQEIAQHHPREEIS